MDIFSRKRLTFWIILILVVLNVCTVGILWHREFARDRMRPMGLLDRLRPKPERFLARELELSAEQVAQLQVMSRRFFAETGPYRHRIHHLRRQIADELFTDQPNIEKVNRCAAEIGEGEKTLAIYTFQHFKALKEIIRPDQQARLRQFLNDLFRRVQPRHQLPGKGAPPPVIEPMPSSQPGDSVPLPGSTSPTAP